MLHQKECNEYLEEKKASDEEKVKKKKDTGPRQVTLHACEERRLPYPGLHTKIYTFGDNSKHQPIYVLITFHRLLISTDGFIHMAAVNWVMMTVVPNTVIQCNYLESSAHKHKIDEALLDMIVKDICPSSIVEDRGFCKLLSTLDPRYVPPSRRTIMCSLLPDRYAVMKEKITSELESVEACSFQ